MVELAPPAAVLEAGIGSGIYSLAFALLGYRVTAIDCVPEVLREARRAAEQVGHPVCGRVRFVGGDLEHPPLRPRSFDVVFNDGVVEHWLDQNERRRLIATLTGLVRPGGVICVIVPHGAHPRHDLWVASHYPGYASAPPMTLYDCHSLRDDLAAADLRDVIVDGVGAWQSFNLWPHRPVWRAPLGVLDRCLPGPRRFRLRYAQSLIACGVVPSRTNYRLKDTDLACDATRHREGNHVRKLLG